MERETKSATESLREMKGEEEIEIDSLREADRGEGERDCDEVNSLRERPAKERERDCDKGSREAWERCRGRPRERSRQVARVRGRETERDCERW